jgi:hypothetical protein
MGRRVADLEWVVRGHSNRRAIDLFEHIADGPVRWAEKRGVPIDTAASVATLLVLSLEFLPALPAPDIDCALEPAVVAEVRALVAKAESTTFPAA